MKYLLIIVVSASQCTVDNIDKTHETVIEMPDMAACEAAAEVTDSQRGVRAFCIEVQP